MTTKARSSDRTIVRAYTDRLLLIIVHTLNVWLDSIRSMNEWQNEFQINYLLGSFSCHRQVISLCSIDWYAYIHCMWCGSGFKFHGITYVNVISSANRPCISLIHIIQIGYCSSVWWTTVENERQWEMLACSFNMLILIELCIWFVPVSFRIMFVLCTYVSARTATKTIFKLYIEKSRSIDSIYAERMDTGQWTATWCFLFQLNTQYSAFLAFVLLPNQKWWSN